MKQHMTMAELLNGAQMDVPPEELMEGQDLNFSKQEVIKSISMSELADGLTNKTIELYTKQQFEKFSTDLKKSFDSNEIGRDIFEKGLKEANALEKRQVMDLNGNCHIVFIRNIEQ